MHGLPSHSPIAVPTTPFTRMSESVWARSTDSIGVLVTAESWLGCPDEHAAAQIAHAMRAAAFTTRYSALWDDRSAYRLQRVLDGIRKRRGLPASE
jgi:hypothetical protein